MKKIYIYFYKITNLINDRFYYGIHKTHNINDGYMGSGTRLKYSIKKYGINNFEKEILEYFDTYEEALIYESEVVTEKLVDNINCYNLKKGGKGGYPKNYYTVFDKNHDMEKIIRVTKDKYYENPDRYVFVNKNKILVRDISGNTMLVNINDERYINNELKHISINKVSVKDKYNNYYQVDINDERYINGELKFIWSNRKHSKKTKLKIGKSNSINQQGEKNSRYGTCWIYNEKLKQNKSIKKEELGIFLNSGWVKGRKMKF